MLAIYSFVGQYNGMTKYNLGSAYGTYKKGAMGARDTVGGSLSHAWISDGLVGLAFKRGIYFDLTPRFTFRVGEVTGIPVDMITPKR